MVSFQPDVVQIQNKVDQFKKNINYSTIKVDPCKHDNLKIPKEKLESLSLSGNDYVGHVKPKQSKEKPLARDNLKLATGKLEDLTLRAARVLSEVSLVAAEDTRETRR